MSTPVWGNSEAYRKTFAKFESPRERYKEISYTAENILRDRNVDVTDCERLGNALFEILWKGWLIPATPVLNNFGRDIGLPISCFGSYIPDSMEGIAKKQSEVLMMSKMGGGTSCTVSDLRPIGSPIKGGKLGTSDGIIPFLKIFDSTIIAAKQGKEKRGNIGVYLDANHPERQEFLKTRDKSSAADPNRMCHNIHHGFNFDDNFMNSLTEDSDENRDFFRDVIVTRVETGEPYTLFIDNANNQRPDYWHEDLNEIKASNLCTEIMLPSDEDHSFVCCLSSLNLAKFDEWEDWSITVGNTEFTVPMLACLLLDCVLDEFITKGKDVYGLDDAVRFAEKCRAIGVGTLGWHTYLQQHGLPFVSIASTIHTNKVYGHIKQECDKANNLFAKKFGEPELLKGTGKRFYTTMAIAPNRNSARYADDVSQGVQPISSNYYMDDGDIGTYVFKNPKLESILVLLGMDTPEVWQSILDNKGSVQHLKINESTKEIFLTAREINQLGLVEQAGVRQQYIDQGQSINLFFPKNAPADFIMLVHYQAWKLGLKSLYYLKSQSVLDADGKAFNECTACEG